MSNDHTRFRFTNCAKWVPFWTLNTEIQVHHFFFLKRKRKIKIYNYFTKNCPVSSYIITVCTVTRQLSVVFIWSLLQIQTIIYMIISHWTASQEWIWSDIKPLPGVQQKGVTQQHETHKLEKYTHTAVELRGAKKKKKKMEEEEEEKRRSEKKIKTVKIGPPS